VSHLRLKACLATLYLTLGVATVMATSPVSDTGLVRYDANNARAISDRQLQQLIDKTVPASSKRLLIFAQCYGGEFAGSSLFNTANTATMSASAANEEAHYGGYHEKAAKGVKPEAGRTGQTVHDEGVAGRFNAGAGFTENPQTGGGLPLSSFSLEPITPTSTVKSRHILIYIGKPDRKVRRDPATGNKVPDAQGKDQFVEDVADRDSIISNFSGQPNTTVHSVGGAPHASNPLLGTNGWDRPGSFDGLAAALLDIKKEFDKAADKSKEQFILFVGDHGDYRIGRSTNANVPATSRSVVAGDFVVPPLTESAEIGLLGDHQNTPAVEFFVDFTDFFSPVEFDSNGDYIPLHMPGDFAVDVTPVGGGTPVVLTDFFEEFRDDGSNELGDAPGEGLQFRFAVDEAIWMSWAGQTVEVAVTNNNLFDVEVATVTFASGPLSRGPHLPDPIFADGFESGDTELWSSSVP
jgi:hypothetical protein